MAINKPYQEMTESEKRLKYLKIPHFDELIRKLEINIQEIRRSGATNVKYAVDQDAFNKVFVQVVYLMPDGKNARINMCYILQLSSWMLEREQKFLDK